MNVKEKKVEGHEVGCWNNLELGVRNEEYTIIKEKENGDYSDP